MFSILAATRPCIPVLIISCSVLPFQTRRLMRGQYKKEERRYRRRQSDQQHVGIKIKTGVTSVLLCSFYNRFKLDLGLGQTHPQSFNITGSRALLLHKSHFAVTLGDRPCAFILKSAQSSQAISFRQTVRKWQQRQLSPDKI